LKHCCSFRLTASLPKVLVVAACGQQAIKKGKAVVSRCPLWVNSGHLSARQVNSGHLSARQECPLYPRKRTFASNAAVRRRSAQLAPEAGLFWATDPCWSGF